MIDDVWIVLCVWTVPILLNIKIKCMGTILLYV